MATIGLSNHKKYFISYGFVGGPLHARKFKRIMARYGFEPVLTPQKAHIIIAHSAGCWLIPSDCNPELVIYVGMPLNQSRPRKTLLAANQARIEAGKSLQWVLKRTKSTYYSFRQPIRNIKIIRMARNAKSVVFPNAKSVFIANQHDPWPVDSQLESYLEMEGWAFLGLPGTHDDIWLNSDRYAEIIIHYAALLD